MELMPVTVYTILQSEKLHAMYRAGGVAKFKEGKRWVAAAKLLAKATASGRGLPIVFAPGENTRELIYQAIIKTISPIADSDKQTAITVSDLKPFRAPRPKKTDLVVVSTGRCIPAAYIRSYVLCHTPSFLSRATAPNSTIERDARKSGARPSL